MHADMVLVNGKIVMMDSQESTAEAVAVKYGRLLKVGKNKEVQGLVGEDTRVIDLKGRCVIPGLIDSHCHMMNVGAGRLLYVDLSEEAGVHSIKDLVEKLRERAAVTDRR